MTEDAGAPLVLIHGDATAEEVAAVTAVVAALAAGRGGGAGPAPKVSQWASRARQVRPPMHQGPGGWRASALPR